MKHGTQIRLGYTVTYADLPIRGQINEDTQMDPRLRSGIFLLGNGHHSQVFDFHDFLKVRLAKSGKF